jgi:molybdopterin-containing oxidoreductase family membrane subunit
VAELPLAAHVRRDGDHDLPHGELHLHLHGLRAGLRRGARPQHGLRKRLYTIFSFGWRGTDKEWHTLGWAYTFFAVFVIPLAVSVHSIVSWDFALSVVPGFHHTIFAPYFVCGAIYSGTAGIVTVMYLLRKYLGLERYIQEDHFDKLGKLLIVLSLIWTYINVMELFTGWYSGGSFEIEALRFKLFGFYAPLFWEMIICCTFVPMLMLSKRIRTNWTWMLWISLFINLGMLTERFIIVATSQPRKFLPTRSASTSQDGRSSASPSDHSPYSRPCSSSSSNGCRASRCMRSRKP